MRRFVVLMLLAATACGRDHKVAPASDLVVEGHVDKTATGLTLTLSAGPPNLGTDDITYTRVETVGLVVRANGSRVQPTGERSQGTLNGGDVIVTLPAIAGAFDVDARGQRRRPR